MLYRIASPARRLAVTARTEIVIEGFPRSANTFAVTAFSTAQNKEMRLAHHIHSPAQVLFAIKRRIPVLVLFRDPNECVRSLLVRHPELSARYAFQSYVNFYKPILEYADRIIFADFEEVVGSFRMVVERLNARFGTTFDLPIETEMARKKVIAEICAINDSVSSGRGDALAFPDSHREKRKSDVVFDETCCYYLESVLLFRRLQELNDSQGRFMLEKSRIRAERPRNSA